MQQLYDAYYVLFGDAMANTSAVIRERRRILEGPEYRKVWKNVFFTEDLGVELKDIITGLVNAQFSDDPASSRGGFHKGKTSFTVTSHQIFGVVDTHSSTLLRVCR